MGGEKGAEGLVIAELDEIVGGQPEKICEVSRVIRESFATVADELGLTAQNCPSHPAFTTDEHVHDLANQGLRFYVLRRGETLAGVVGVRQLNDEAWSVEKLAVLPSHRHAGFGRKLMDHALNVIVEAGGKRAAIAVVDENETLKKWYIAQDFRVTEIRRYEHLPFSVCYMEKVSIRAKQENTEQSMDVELTPIAYEHKSVLRHLMELCLHDYSEFDGADVDEHGLFGYRRIDHYWTEDGRHAFLMKVASNIAGFVLVRDSSNTGDAHSVAEFFVLRKYRRKGVGRRAAHGVFNMFPGIWRVHQDKDNTPAQAFWRAVIGEYSHDCFREVSMDGVEGPAQEFRSSGDAR